jgi:cell division protein FtsB
MMVRTRKQPLTPMRLIKPLAWMFMAFYVGYHTLHGERGLYALLRERRELTTLQTELDTTKAEREKMELKVSHLRDDSLDRDLLDEQMRRMLGVMKKGEVVVLTDPNPNTP